jgi:Carbohydrate binding domain
MTFTITLGLKIIAVLALVGGIIQGYVALKEMIARHMPSGKKKKQLFILLWFLIAGISLYGAYNQALLELAPSSPAPNPKATSVPTVASSSSTPIATATSISIIISSSPTQRETPTEGISLSPTPINMPIPTDTPTPSPTPILSPQPIYGPELLSNPGFEMGNNSYWNTLNGSGPVTTSHSVYCNQLGRAYEGNCFEEANSNQPDDAGSISQDVTMATLPGQSYTLSCWFRSPTGVPFSAILALWDAGGPKHESVNQSVSAGDTWQQVSLNLVTTMQNPTIRVQIYLGTADSNIDIDACSLKKMLS